MSRLYERKKKGKLEFPLIPFHKANADVFPSRLLIFRGRSLSTNGYRPMPRKLAVLAALLVPCAGAFVVRVGAPHRPVFQLHPVSMQVSYTLSNCTTCG